MARRSYRRGRTSSRRRKGGTQRKGTYYVSRGGIRL